MKVDLGAALPVPAKVTSQSRCRLAREINPSARAGQQR